MNKVLSPSPSGRRYGYLPGPRSYSLSKLIIPLAPRIASSIDLSPWEGPHKDQGSLGACTAFAGTEDLEYGFRRYKNTDPVLSPLFLYYQERLLDGDLDQGDTGSTGNTSCRVLNHVGCCLESSMPYDPGVYQSVPSPSQFEEAKSYRHGAYHSVMTLADIRSCLASGYGIRMGFTVYESFEGDKIANTGIMPVPDKAKEQVLGGHEVWVKGFDDSKQSLLVKNSWGTSWGKNGDFLFPYECVNDLDVFMDGRMQHFGPAWVPK